MNKNLPVLTTLLRVVSDRILPHCKTIRVKRLKLRMCHSDQEYRQYLDHMNKVFLPAMAAVPHQFSDAHSIETSPRDLEFGHLIHDFHLESLQIFTTVRNIDLLYVFLDNDAEKDDLAEIAWLCPRLEDA